MISYNIKHVMRTGPSNTMTMQLAAVCNVQSGLKVMKLYCMEHV